MLVSNHSVFDAVVVCQDFTLCAGNFHILWTLDLSSLKRFEELFNPNGAGLLIKSPHEQTGLARLSEPIALQLLKACSVV